MREFFFRIKNLTFLKFYLRLREPCERGGQGQREGRGGRGILKELLYSWRFSCYSAPIHWLVHGHMSSKIPPNIKCHKHPQAQPETSRKL